MNLTDIPRKAPEIVLAGLRDDNPSKSKEASAKLVAMAKDSGLSLKDYLTLAIDTTQSEKPQRFEGLNGFEAALLELNLPFRQDLENGVLLQAAADTFQKYPGTRAMFPEVIDTMVRWKNRQDQIEKVEPLVAQSRTISGTEMISTVVEDSPEARQTFSIAEFGNIPDLPLRRLANCRCAAREPARQRLGDGDLLHGDRARPVLSWRAPCGATPTAVGEHR